MIERAAIQALANEIGRQFDVERVILFGSYAYGKPHADSDVDLIVVMDFEGRPRDQARLVSHRVSHVFPRDLIVRTPAELRRCYEENDPLVRDVIERGEVLYERDDCRVAR